MKIINRILAALAVSAGFLAISCEDQPDAFRLADGVPELHYVRIANPESADSLITGAYMDNLICLVGKNLRSVHQLWFNDQQAVLNTSYMTDNTILVTVPKNIPVDVTNKMYMITKQLDTVAADFKVLVPAPSVLSINNEFTKDGEVATIYGDYFLDDPNIPLTISMQGNVEVPYKNIKSISKTAVSFVVPDNAPAGYITVGTQYGSSRSKFYFRDDRNILFDWDGSRGGMALGYGWRDGSKLLRQDGDDSFPGVDGAYIKLSGAEVSGEIGATWAEDNHCVNYWPDPANGKPALSSLPAFADMIEKYGVAGLQVKFEVLVPSSAPWSSAALQIMFTSDADVTYATGNNNYYGSTSLPRGVWMPWLASGSYDTADQWTTVAVPFSDFTKTHENAECATAFNETFLTGFTLFLWHGGVAGTTCNPEIAIDNIRVVPVE